MSDEELEMLHDIATERGLTSSDVVRTLIRREHASVQAARRKGAK